MQTIITISIIAGAIVYLGIKLYRMLTPSAIKQDKCSGCAGCGLKKSC